MNKLTLDALFAAVFAVFAAFVGVILTPFWNDLSAAMKPVIGEPLVALIGIVILIGVAAFGLAVFHYFGILGAGAEPAGTRERNDYDSLRQRIASGNWIAREYARRLNIFLNAIDRFFGDAGMADRTLFPHAFGLRKPAPIWTAPAFDRCLLLALVYPIVAIFLIWGLSNHIGPAERALGLHAAADWLRTAVLLVLGFVSFAFWRYVITNGLRSFAWLVVALAFTAVFIVLIVTVTGGGKVALGGAIGASLAALCVGAIAVRGVNGIGAPLVALAVGLVFSFASEAVLVVVVVFAATLATVIAENRFTERGYQGIFLFVFSLIVFLACFSGAMFLSHYGGWGGFGSLLLFLGLLTLINAPFDWLSLGLTRVLMRRGLEREKWWPYLYAVLDALLASAVIALLAVAMVAGVQLFDDLAVYGGGERVLPPMGEFLDAIRANPGKPEYWWVYATLFSTMLPSLINLLIAGVSLARGVPGVSSWLLSKVRVGEAVPAYDRLLVAIVLALQNVVGLTIAVAAQGFLFWVIIWQGMPRLGIGVLDLAYYVAH